MKYFDWQFCTFTVRPISELFKPLIVGGQPRAVPIAIELIPAKQHVALAAWDFHGRASQIVASVGFSYSALKQIYAAWIDFILINPLLVVLILLSINQGDFIPDFMFSCMIRKYLCASLVFTPISREPNEALSYRHCSSPSHVSIHWSLLIIIIKF